MKYPTSLRGLSLILITTLFITLFPMNIVQAANGTIIISPDDVLAGEEITVTDSSSRAGWFSSSGNQVLYWSKIMSYYC